MIARRSECCGARAAETVGHGWSDWFWVVLLSGMAVGLWFYMKPEPVAAVEEAAAEEAPAVNEDALASVLHHRPGDPASGELAEILERIQKKDGALVVVTQVDVQAMPEEAREAGRERAAACHHVRPKREVDRIPRALAAAESGAKSR